MLSGKENNQRRKDISFLWVIWRASFVVIGVMLLLCHLFHDWAKWFPVVTEPEFILIWFPKPVIVSLNVFLILAIIVCLRIRNMRTVQRSINKLKKLINKALPEESVVLHIYSRSVMWSIIISVLMATCGTVGFFLTRDYFVLYLFVSMAVAFLVINRPKLADIEKIKVSLEDSKSADTLMPEKKRNMWNKIRLVLLMMFLFPVTCSYLEYRNVDPDGECKGFKNVGICLDALGLSRYFSELPNDDEMIERFRKHRQDYENMRKDADLVLQKKLSETYWRKKYAAIVNGGVVFACFPRAIYTDFEQYKPCGGPFMYNFENPDNRLFAFAFETDRTKYIKGADYGWPHNSHEKGYVYFPIVPKIENGRVIGSKTKNGSRITWRLFDRLDGKWPEDMKGWEYRLRRIDPQWFLYISKDHVGG